MAEWSAEQVVFLDESGVNAHSGERTNCPVPSALYEA